MGMDMLETALCYDQLQAGNLACLELVGRWMQLLENAVATNAGKPD